MKINERLEKYLIFTILVLIITIVLMTVWVYNENMDIISRSSIMTIKT